MTLAHSRGMIAVFHPQDPMKRAKCANTDGMLRISKKGWVG
ncbi:MAG: hypothetical protein ACLPTJ_17870 [Solirubrobacteraceae bacterium]